MCVACEATCKHTISLQLWAHALINWFVHDCSWKEEDKESVGNSRHKKWRYRKHICIQFQFRVIKIAAGLREQLKQQEWDIISHLFLMKSKTKTNSNNNIATVCQSRLSMYACKLSLECVYITSLVPRNRASGQQGKKQVCYAPNQV